MGEEFSPPRCMLVRTVPAPSSTPPRPCGSTYRPTWGAGTLASDVVAGAPVLAGAAQLTVSPVASRWAQLLTAAWEAEALDTAAFGSGGRAPGLSLPALQGSLGVSGFTANVNCIRHKVGRDVVLLPARRGKQGSAIINWNVVCWVST